MGLPHVSGGIPERKKESRILSSGAWVSHHGDLEDCEDCRGSLGRPQGWVLAFWKGALHSQKPHGEQTRRHWQEPLDAGCPGFLASGSAHC